MKKSNQIQISSELVQATIAYLEAVTKMNEVRPVVEAMQKEILQKMNAVSEFDGEPITEPSKAWTMNDERFIEEYCPAMDEALKAAGFVVPEGYCPLLMAEEGVRVAQRAMIAAAKYFTGVDVDDILCAKDGLKQYNKFINLLVLGVTGSPEYKAVKG